MGGEKNSIFPSSLKCGENSKKEGGTRKKLEVRLDLLQFGSVRSSRSKTRLDRVRDLKTRIESSSRKSGSDPCLRLTRSKKYLSLLNVSLRSCCAVVWGRGGKGRRRIARILLVVVQPPCLCLYMPPLVPPPFPLESIPPQEILSDRMVVRPSISTSSVACKADFVQARMVSLGALGGP